MSNAWYSVLNLNTCAARKSASGPRPNAFSSSPLPPGEPFRASPEGLSAGSTYVQVLMSRPGAGGGAVPSDGGTLHPFLRAAAAGDTASLEAQFHPVCLGLADADGKTALHYAASSNQEGAVAWLLARGADIEIRTKKGECAVRRVARGGGMLLPSLSSPSLFPQSHINRRKLLTRPNINLTSTSSCRSNSSPLRGVSWASHPCSLAAGAGRGSVCR